MHCAIDKGSLKTQTGLAPVIVALWGLGGSRLSVPVSGISDGKNEWRGEKVYEPADMETSRRELGAERSRLEGVGRFTAPGLWGGGKAEGFGGTD